MDCNGGCMKLWNSFESARFIDFPRYFIFEFNRRSLEVTSLKLMILKKCLWWGKYCYCIRISFEFWTHPIHICSHHARYGNMCAFLTSNDLCQWLNDWIYSTKLVSTIKYFIDVCFAVCFASAILNTKFKQLDSFGHLIAIFLLAVRRKCSYLIPFRECRIAVEFNR